MPLSNEQAARRLSTLSVLVTASIAGLIAFGLSVMIMLVWLAFSVSSNTRDIQRNAQANTDALCALRTDIRVRHDSALDYLQSHPMGLLDKYGNVLLSAQQLRKSIHDQESTLSALHGLNCETTP